MGRTLYGYADKIWEVDKSFSYTGAPEEFTLDPGKYLFIVNGAAGGGTNASSFWGYGATAYGIFETNQEEIMYAVVGGNGKSYSTGTNGIATPGGYNGGGDGGYFIQSTGNYASGGSGGGASDIRLTLDDTPVAPYHQYNLPSDFIELEDIHLQWEERAQINTGYHTTPNTRIETTMRFHSRSCERRTTYQIPFGTRVRNDGPDELWMCVRNSDIRALSKMGNQYFYDDNNLFPYDEKVNIVYDTLHKFTSWVSESGKSKTINFTYTITQAASTYPLMIFTLNHEGNPGDYHPFGMRMYDFKIYEQDPNGIEDDQLVHHYIPAQRKSDNMYGVYDLIDQEFIAYTPYATNHRMFGTPYPSNSRTLLSRIIVAGGGGGDATHMTYGFPIMGYGGGTTAGFVCMRQNGSAYSHTDCLPASQDEGYTFGKGEDGWVKSYVESYGAEGAGGGGGGWFGGYSEAYYNASYSSISGSGGSSYALTADSWKPYGYIPTSHYYLQDTALVGCQTTEGSILICKEAKILNNDDIITIPLTGRSDKIDLFPGKYMLKCYGGEGGITYEKGTSITRYHGGYSAGILTLPNKTSMYGIVGSSGLFRRGHTASSKFAILNEIASFNGGGDTVTVPMSYYHIPWNGGGGTDIRLSMDTSPVHEPEPDPDTRDDIPEGYTQMKSTFTNGGNPFESGVIVTSDTEFIYDFKIDPGVSGSYPTVFGSDDGPNYHSFVLFAWNGGTGHLALDGGGVNIGHLPKNHRLVLETKLSETTITVIIHDKDEDMDYTYIGNRSLFVGTTKGLTFNCLNRGGYGNHINNTTYGIKFKVNGVITHDFVPIKRDSDGTIGLYDIVGESFKTYNYTATATPLQTATYSSKTLMSRFIVAGGAGGMGCNDSQAGKGGGINGGSIPSGYYGTHPGPGTQTGSPKDETYPGINGGFGYGGKGYVANNGRGGAGGGGWYGGSGTYPDSSSDDDKAGAGGSGYILTESSYKPKYLVPDETYYLDEAITTVGGNTLPPNISKIEITVIEANCLKMIIHDSQGYKRYDTENNTWTVFSTEMITPEDIEEYGQYVINDLEGVMDQFEVLLNDEENIASSCSVDVFEKAQSITWVIPKRYKIARTIVDGVYDDNLYSFSQNVSKYDESHNAYTLKIEKSEDIESILKLYSIQLFSK